MTSPPAAMVGTQCGRAGGRAARPGRDPQVGEPFRGGDALTTVPDKDRCWTALFRPLSRAAPFVRLQCTPLPAEVIAKGQTGLDPVQRAAIIAPTGSWRMLLGNLGSAELGDVAVSRIP